MPIRNIFAWTDSTVVLSWISSESYRWVPFVANRIEKIQSTVTSVKWRYISSKQNPADCATRGLFPLELLKCDLWLSGPDWLYKNDSELNTVNETLIVNEDEIRREERKMYKATTCTLQDNEIFERYSSWSKLRRIIALCFRFIHNCRNPPAKRLRGFLTSEELRIASVSILKKVQLSYFCVEISCLKSNKELSAHSKILPLTPFLDNEGLLRVGGRLKNANIPESQKFPILLPKKCHITNLIIMHYHINYLHAAQELLLSILRMQFWILSGRSEVRKIIHRCLPCVKNRGKTASQLMANLPSTRVQPSRPFTVTGIDYAGPFIIKSRSGRGVKSLKCYISIFVCFSTKAIHLELVSDLSTATFLAALKRFIARRGKPSKIVSDCATNFKKASKELKEVYTFASKIEKSDKVNNFIANEGIIWTFNPPAAPHFGGIWESNIKCVKFHLKRVIGSTMLTYEEFITLLCQVEACLNSRPICAMSSDPNDYQALTPGHFLIGTPLVAIPERDLSEISMSKLKRWQLVQKMLQHLWKRWNSEYISTLQQKCKWFRNTPNLKPGDLVVVKNEQLPPCLWKFGRISEIHPGSDGRVRVVTITTPTGQFKRPISKLCPLPIEHCTN